MKLLERGPDGKWYSPVWFIFIVLVAFNCIVIATMQWVSETYLVPWHINAVAYVITAVLT